MNKYFLSIIIFTLAYIGQQLAIDDYKRQKLFELYNTEHHLSNINNNSEIDVIIFGDSRAASWEEKYFDPKLNIINMGIYGETTNSMLARVDSNILSYSPKYVIICAGINDIITASLLKNPFERQKIIDEAVNNMLEISRKLSSNNIQVIILLLTPPYKPDLIRKYIWGDEIDLDVQLVNIEIAKHARYQQNTTILDTHNLFISHSDQWMGYFRLDALHYTPLAYKQLSFAVNKIINGEE